VIDTLPNSMASANWFYFFVLWTGVVAPAKAGAPVQNLNFIPMKSVVKKSVGKIMNTYNFSIFLKDIISSFLTPLNNNKIVAYTPTQIPTTNKTFNTPIGFHLIITKDIAIEARILFNMKR